MSNLKEFKDVPDDVIWVWTLRFTGAMVGAATMQKINKIIDDNPKYFEWEHKYKSIPQEVHEAFKDEVWPDRNKPFKLDAKKHWSALEDATLFKQPSEPLTKESFQKILDDYCKVHAERKEAEIAERKRIKAIWDKHYRKYNLEYRQY